MKRSSVVIIFLLATVMIETQAQSKTDSICWCTNYRLKWSDFQGIPEQGTEWTALTYTSLKILEEEKKCC